MVVPYIHAGEDRGPRVRVGCGSLERRGGPRWRRISRCRWRRQPAVRRQNDVPRNGHRSREGDLPRAGKGFGKPDKILDKIADGKLEKYFGDFCLVEQAFIKDPDRKVSQFLADAGKTAAPRSG